MFVRQVGIDLGTVSILVYVRGKGIVLREPSVVAISVRDNRIMAVGREAHSMLGRTPETIEVLRPMRDGVIADYVVTERMLHHFIRKVCGRVHFKPTVMISVPVGVTSVESRAVHDAALAAGAREAFLIPEPLAAALGAGLPVGTATGNMIVDIGGGTCEAAVISVNGIVVASSVRTGGCKLDDAVASFIRRKYNLLIGDQMAEEAKIGIGSALSLEQELTMDVRGRDQMTGLPRTIQITSAEITEAIAEPLAVIVNNVRSVLEKTPPELASDIIDRGMVMTGGTSLLRNIDRFLTRHTGVPCHVAENPVDSVALGAGKALEMIDILRRTLPA
ncbi:MAG TPA: rod shape-determining protein [Anaerolineae bacterium]|nr:rod shape-determining protein [Anaerolineae bacterium]HOR00736.1 rod shape-determining protein [Anaerolineae bacterium]HPL29065.1 rod shape-determining protein [Anaerolineae bacterium]